MNSNLDVRIANESDAESLLKIYRPYVQNTAISFETTVPTIAEFEKRIRAVNDDWLWLVAMKGDLAIGFAYGSAHRPRKAYKYSVETSAYIQEFYHRQGVARMLYNKLLFGLANSCLLYTSPSPRD